MDAIGIVSCVGFVAVLFGWGLAARGLTARRSGWRRLSRRYPAGRPSAGLRFARATVRVNGTWYRDHLDVCVNGAGIRLSVPPAFRPFHPPVFVPWDDVAPAHATPDQEPDATDDGQAVVSPSGSTVSLTLTGPAAHTAQRALARRAAADGRHSGRPRDGRPGGHPRPH